MWLEVLCPTFSDAELRFGAKALLTFFLAENVLSHPLRTDAKVPRGCRRALQAGAELRGLVSPGRRQFLIPLICDVD